jgi:hypothetical protein
MILFFCKESLFYKDFSYNCKKNINKLIYNLNSSSASITYNPKNDGYILIVRNINYKLDKNGISIKNDKNNNILSMNTILILDKYFNYKISYDLKTESRNSPYIGIEDVRFFNFKNIIYYIGSYYNESDGRIKIVSEIYNPGDLELKPNIITPDFYTNNNWEKNWVFFNNNDNELNVIYKWKPIQICKIDYDSKKLLLIKENNNVPDFFNKISGSSNGVEYDNKIYFIAHSKNKISEGMSYLHIFIVFDKNMTLIGYSDYFKFGNCLVEFCTGMIINKNTNNFIITYSLLDKTTKLSVFSPYYINSIITNKTI